MELGTGLTPAQIVQKMVSDAAAQPPPIRVTAPPATRSIRLGELLRQPRVDPAPPADGHHPPPDFGSRQPACHVHRHRNRSDGPIVSATWKFGNGTTGDGLSASTVYTAPGVYRVSLTVTDRDGLTATAHGRVVTN